MRNRFLQLIVAAVILFSTAWSHAADTRPNIVFIMSDDHAYQAISAYGSRVNETPNIDRIAKGGLRFDRCVVTNSICAPSRATILTGKYSHKNGVPNNFTPFDGSQTTFPKLLQAAGYQTAFIGKWHLKSEPTGFDHWDRLPGQGKYYRPVFVSPAGRRTVPGYATDVITKLALDWLHNDRDAERPFLLMVHHKAPHRPWNPGPKHLTTYKNVPFAEPETLFDDYASRSSAARTATMRIDQMTLTSDLKIWDETDDHRSRLYRNMSAGVRALWEEHYDPRQQEFAEVNPQGRDRTRWFYRLYLTDYLGCIASVDDSVGRILDYLDEEGLAENTLVIYTSDQGFYIGEHGWFDKRFMYEESLRTPLLVRWPHTIQPSRADDHIVSNVDFAETFLEVAGAEIPAEMQGRSLLPLLKGESPDDWRESFYYAYLEGPERYHHVARHEGVATDRYKLIHYYEIGEWELLDREADPLELRSVYDEPEYEPVVKRLKAELSRLKRELEVPEHE